MPVIGLAGFWLPLAIVWFRGSPVYTVFEQLLYAGTLASFCVAILAEGLLSLLTAEKAGSNFNALGIRGMVGAWAIGVIILLVGVMGADVALASGPHVGVGFHVLLGVIALSTAAYLYCFRFPSWEKGVEDAKEEEEHEVAELGASAKEQSVDGGDQVMNISVVPFEQPAGRFLLAVMKASDIIRISRADPRRFDAGVMKSEGGIQRTVSLSRVNEIAEYAKMVDATFPTPILLALAEGS